MYLLVLYLSLALFLWLSSQRILRFRSSWLRLKKKRPWFSIAAFCIVTVTLYSASIHAIDSFNYQYRFDHIDTLPYSTDVLYIYFVRFIRIFTNNYPVYRGIIGVIYLLPVLYIIWHETSINLSMFLLLCCLFPYFQNMVSLRNTIAASIAVFALYKYLSSNQQIKDISLTFVLLGIASLIHDTFIFYILVFLLFQLFTRIQNKKWVYYSLIACGLLMVMLIRLPAVSALLQSILDDTNNAFYISIMEHARLGFLIPVCLQIGFTVLLNMIIRRYHDPSTDTFDQSVLLLNFSAVIFMPLYAINVLFFRLFRNMLTINYLVAARHYHHRKQNIISIVLTILCIISMFYDANGIGSMASIMLN